MSSLICDKIKVRKERTLEIKVKGMTYHVELSPQKIVIPNIGNYNGEKQTPDIKSNHMCGLQGYDPMLGDTCPACEEFRKYSAIMDSIISRLRKKKILKKYDVLIL